MSTQGALAVKSGMAAEEMIRSMLRVAGYRLTIAKTLSELQAERRGLFPETGCYAFKCKVPLVASYHCGKHHAEVDFVVCTPVGEYVLISSKRQNSNGSAEEKLEYELQQLIATELPAAMFVMGPVKGRDAETGWSLHVLQQIWERARHFGGSRLLLFRKVERLQAWISNKMPVRSGAITASAIFDQYCDREP